MKSFSKQTIRWIFFVFGIVFFCIYLSLFIRWGSVGDSPAAQFDLQLTPVELVLGQPDYAVNYTAIRTTFFQQRATQFEPLSALTMSQVHPRSTTVIHSRITPIGFPGIIVLFGIILHALVFLFGFQFFNLFFVALIPAIAALTPRIFYAVLKPIFGKRISLLSSILLFVMPFWWYYAHWPVQHHTLLLFFFLSFLWAGRKAIKTKKKDWQRRGAYAALAGTVFALCIYIRPAEAIWLMGVAISLVILLRKKVFKPSFLLPFFGLAACIAVVYFATQLIFYGDLFGSGYVVPTAAGDSGSILSGALERQLWMLILFPHGLSAYAIIQNVYGFIWTLVWPWFVLGAFGTVHLFTKANQSFRRYRAMCIYTILWLAVSAYLIVIYGSAGFQDNLAAVQFTIGGSHTRYWLPIFVFALPLCVRGALVLVQPITKAYRTFILLFGLLILGVWSGTLVYNGPDGIDQLQASAQQFYAERELIQEYTQEDAIIVTPFADKYLYPTRDVIVTLDEEPQKAYDAIRRLLDREIPLYYYANTLSEDIELQRRALFADEMIQFAEEPLFEQYAMQLWSLTALTTSTDE